MSERAITTKFEESGEPDPVKVAFVLQLVRALHSYGESAQRLEDLF